MLNIIVNGEARSVNAATIPDLLRSEQLPEAHWQSIAVARNGRVITRNAWHETQLQNGDQLEIVKPFVGG